MWSMILLGLLIWGGVGLLWILAFNVLGLKYDAAEPEAEQVPGTPEGRRAAGRTRGQRRMASGTSTT